MGDVTTSHDERPIVAWDNRPFTWQTFGRGGRDGYNDDLSHAYVETPEPSELTKACQPTTLLSRSNLTPGGRLQEHPPELPLCPRCAATAGLRFVV